MNIGIIDDHVLFRSGLKALIPDKYTISLEAENGIEMIDKIKTLAKSKIPTILFLDINMPKMDGFATADWLKANYPSIKIIVLTLRDDEESILRMIKLDVKAYLTKMVEASELLEALKNVEENGMYYNSRITKVLVKNLQGENLNGKQQELISLSEKEISFLKFSCTELTYSEIAARMSVSPRTIDGYKESLFSKLNVKSRVGLVIYAIKNNYFIPS